MFIKQKTSQKYTDQVSSNERQKPTFPFKYHKYRKFSHESIDCRYQRNKKEIAAQVEQSYIIKNPNEGEDKKEIFMAIIIKCGASTA